MNKDLNFADSVLLRGSLAIGKGDITNPANDPSTNNLLEVGSNIKFDNLGKAIVNAIKTAAPNGATAEEFKFGQNNGEIFIQHGSTVIGLNTLITGIANASFIGSATAATNPGTPSTNVWYFADGAGSYTNFLSAPSTALVVSPTDTLVILSFDSTTGFWRKTNVAVDLSTYTKVTDFTPVKTIADTLDSLIKQTDDTGDFWTDDDGFIVAQIVGEILSALKIKPGSLLFGDDVEIARGDGDIVYEMKVEGVPFLKISSDDSDWIKTLTDSAGNIRAGIDRNFNLRGFANLPDSPLSGLKGAVMGDSISTLDYGALLNGELYWQLIQKWNNIASMAVSAISGTTVRTTAGTPYATVQPGFVDGTRISDLGVYGQPDFILTFGSTNDFQGNRQVTSFGTINDPDTLLTSFFGALKNYFRRLQQTYPASKLFFMTPIQRSDMGFPIYNSSNGTYLYQFVDAIKLVAKDYGIIIIDTYQESGLNYWNYTAANNSPGIAYSLDKVHPINTAQRKIAAFVNSQLLKHFK